MIRCRRTVLAPWINGPGVQICDTENDVTFAERVVYRARPLSRFAINRKQSQGEEVNLQIMEFHRRVDWRRTSKRFRIL